MLLQFVWHTRNISYNPLLYGCNAATNLADCRVRFSRCHSFDFSASCSFLWTTPKSKPAFFYFSYFSLWMYKLRFCHACYQLDFRAPTRIFLDEKCFIWLRAKEYLFWIPLDLWLKTHIFAYINFFLSAKSEIFAREFTMPRAARKETEALRLRLLTRALIKKKFELLKFTHCAKVFLGKWLNFFDLCSIYKLKRQLTD